MSRYWAPGPHTKLSNHDLPCLYRQVSNQKCWGPLHSFRPAPPPGPDHQYFPGPTHWPSYQIHPLAIPQSYRQPPHTCTHCAPLTLVRIQPPQFCTHSAPSDTAHTYTQHTHNHNTHTALAPLYINSFILTFFFKLAMCKQNIGYYVRFFFFL